MKSTVKNSGRSILFLPNSLNGKYAKMQDIDIEMIKNEITCRIGKLKSILPMEIDSVS